MAISANSELVLIRHAPSLADGRLCGRMDVAAKVPEAEALAPVQAALSGIARVVQSPAQRCRQTAGALWPDMTLETDQRLWEQDFGTHDGLPYAELPDLGPLEPAELANYAAPGGESFAQMCARVQPALREMAEAAQGGSIAVVAHAGTVRAGLALALGAVPAALTFEVAPLSITRLRCHAAGLSIICTNWALA